MKNIEIAKHAKLKKGDKVKVTLGKDNGKQATIERINRKTNQVYLAGLNTYKRHVKGQGQVEGGIIEIIKPINLSNVILVCPNCQKTTRIGFKVNGKEKMRVCHKCGKEIK